MKTTTLVLTSLTLLGAAAFATASTLQDDANARGHQEESPVAKPGPQHEFLASLAGQWDVKASMMGLEFDGTYHLESIHDGLWLRGDYEGAWPFGTFTGTALWGYDQDSERFVSTWVDSVSTHMQRFEGKREGKTLLMKGRGKNPMTGEWVEEIQKMTFADADHWDFAMLQPDGEGGHLELLEIRYTRRK